MVKNKKGNYYDHVFLANKEIDLEIQRVLRGDIDEYNVSGLVLLITGSFPVGEKVVLKRVQRTADVGLIVVEDGLIKRKF